MAPIGTTTLTAPSADAGTGGSDTDCMVMWLLGEHDISTAPGLWADLVAAMAVDDADLVLDLSGLGFLDAAIVGLFVRAQETLRAQSRTLTLRAPTTFARQIFGLCGISSFLEPDPVTLLREVDPAAALGTWVEVPPSKRDAANPESDPHGVSESVSSSSIVSPR